MTKRTLLQEIEEFLAETGMKPSYFGKKATGNSELVSRLTAGRPILNSTEQRVRDFIAQHRKARAA